MRTCLFYSLVGRIVSQRFSDTGQIFFAIITETEELDMERVKLRIAELRRRKNITQ